MVRSSVAKKRPLRSAEGSRTRLLRTKNHTKKASRGGGVNNSRRRGPGYASRGVPGTTRRCAGAPATLLADEHHQWRDGQKNYIATTAGAGCCLGAALAQTAGADDLQQAYGVFNAEARDAQPGYAPRTVSADGWAATRQAWQALFPLAAF